MDLLRLQHIEQNKLFYLSFYAQYNDDSVHGENLVYK